MPTYADCQERFDMIAECVIDLDSPTFRDIWFDMVRDLRRSGCWEQALNLMKIARAHERGIPCNPKSFHRYYKVDNNLLGLTGVVTNNRGSSSILSKGKTTI